MFREPVVVVGGGIAGLASAIALRKAGMHANVFERAPELREVGAGVALSANATFALDQLGGLNEVLKHSAILSSLSIRDVRGRVIKYVQIPQMKTPMLALHRADLQQTLYRLLSAGCVYIGETCREVGVSADDAVAVFASGRKERGGIVIGADGLHSTVRLRLGLETATNYSGYISWRSVTKFRHSWLSEAEAMEGWGSGQRIGIIPLRDARTYWYAAANLPEPRHEALPLPKQQLLRMFEEWMPSFREMITETETIVEAPIFDRAPTLPWARGRAVLVGDAAHPSTPNLGQGACMALEDSVVLARCLRNSADVVASLQQFETERHPRCSRIVRTSRMLGSIGQWQNPFAVRMRNFLTSIQPRSSIQCSMNFIHAYEPSL